MKTDRLFSLADAKNHYGDVNLEIQLVDVELLRTQAAVAVWHDGILWLTFVLSHDRDACVSNHQIAAANVENH